MALLLFAEVLLFDGEATGVVGAGRLLVLLVAIAYSSTFVRSVCAIRSAVESLVLSAGGPCMSCL